VSATRRKPYARWRAASLLTLYVLIVAHVVHWKVAGRTLAPLELNEVMYTIELGIVTAGFLFMLLAFLSAAVFGRFFCSWGCHILALEDLSAWILKKLRIQPSPVRSRALLLVPVGAAIYMLVWPTVKRIAAGQPAPSLKIFSDAQGWASFVTENLWRNLPGPWISALTLGTCCAAIVYFLGSRSFCTYGCPYGVLFAAADRLAPGKITGGNECAQCGACTAACQSHVQVQEELAQFGRVVNPSCLKDLDCVAACPHDNIGYRFTKPSFFASWRKGGRFGVPYDFTLGEDLLMAAVFLATVFVFRGLYAAVPFLLTLGLGGILAYVAVLTLRLVRARDVRFGTRPIKLGGKLLPGGRVFASFAAGLALFTGHSAFIRYHETQGQASFDAVKAALERGDPSAAAQSATAIRHLEACVRFGLVRPLGLDRQLASLYLARGESASAEPHVRRILDLEPGEAEWRVTLAAVLLTRGDVEAAVRELDRVVGTREAPAGPRQAAEAMLAEIRAAQADAFR
jgi:polyferredoxin